MIGYSLILKAIRDLISRGVVKQIYHSVEIWDHNGERFPAYKSGDEWMYVGVDDTKQMAGYFREISGFKAEKIIEIGNGRKAYSGTVTYRLVVFNDFEERSHDDLLIALLAFTFDPGIRLKKVFSSNDEILKEEAKVKDFTFGATTFYKAIDFTVTVLLNKTCQDQIGCGLLPNPIDTDKDFSVDFPENDFS